LSGFKGDQHFLDSANAQKMFSKLRGSQAGVYSWRLGASPSDKQALVQEADFAFKQAFALCPYSPEAVYRYVSFLVNQKRKPEALLIVQTAAHVNPKNRQFPGLAANLSR